MANDAAIGAVDREMGVGRKRPPISAEDSLSQSERQNLISVSFRGLQRKTLAAVLPCERSPQERNY
jgi:hypothetical protein